MNPMEPRPLILVVDDEPAVRQWVCAILEKEGYHVAEAADGDQALAIVRRDNPAVMVLDVFLQGKEGLETILELRKEHHPIRILATSGGPILGYDVLTVARFFGAHAVLAKPYPAEVLLNRIAQVLNQAEPVLFRPEGDVSDRYSAWG
jgi:DNA-binding response OmpR family regulator